MIGDSPNIDLKGASGAGIQCLLSREFADSEPAEEGGTWSVATIAELPLSVARV